MFIKCHNHLPHVLDYEVGCTNIIVKKGCSLDIFEKIASTNKI
jgi:hypothetical protein